MQVTIHFPSIGIGLVIGAMISFVSLALGGIRMAKKKELKKEG